MVLICPSYIVFEYLDSSIYFQTDHHFFGRIIRAQLRTSISQASAWTSLWVAISYAENVSLGNSCKQGHASAFWTTSAQLVMPHKTHRVILLRPHSSMVGYQDVKMLPPRQWPPPLVALQILQPCQDDRNLKPMLTFCNGKKLDPNCQSLTEYIDTESEGDNITEYK